MDTPTPEKLSVTDWVVLALIDEEPRHGFSVARELKIDGPIGQVWTVPRPLVYRALDHLRDSGLIEPIGTEPGQGGPVRTVFGVTGLGQRRIRTWLNEPVEHPREVRVELIAKFIFAARRGRSTNRLVSDQLAKFQPIAKGLKQKAVHAEGADRVVALWRLESMRAITRLLDAMAAGSTDDGMPANP